MRTIFVLIVFICSSVALCEELPRIDGKAFSKEKWEEYTRNLLIETFPELYEEISNLQIKVYDSPIEAIAISYVLGEDGVMDKALIGLNLFKGQLYLIKTEEELLLVLTHEIGHYVLEYDERKILERIGEIEVIRNENGLFMRNVRFEDVLPELIEGESQADAWSVKRLRDRILDANCKLSDFLSRVRGCATCPERIHALRSNGKCK